MSMEYFTNSSTTTRWRPPRRNVPMTSLMFYTYAYLCIFATNAKCDEIGLQQKDIQKQTSKLEVKVPPPRTDVDSNASLEGFEKVTEMNCEDHKKGGGNRIMYKAKLHIDYSKGEDIIDGYYGCSSHVNRETPFKAQLVLFKTANNSDLGCSAVDPAIVPPKGKWIALVKRGICNFNKKIYYAAKLSNASAVVIYMTKKHEKDNKVVLIQANGTHEVSDVISVFIPDINDGNRLVKRMEMFQNVTMTISFIPEIHKPTTETIDGQFTANNTSVLFVSISFIVLIIISLAWLVFYYIQRCRYTNAKERLSRRLANAAKKAIAKIPQRPVKYGDKELDSEADQCAVCIEPYKVSDVIRVLPCKHVFHKSCVDPWLLDQRNCPMCKMDILRAFGMHLNGSQESVPQEAESGMISSSPVIEETERLSTSEEQGAVGGVKIVLYQHPSVHYSEGGSRQFHDCELSSEGSLDLCSSPVAQCHVECRNDIVLENESVGNIQNAMIDDQEASLARSVSLEEVQTSDDECNEIHSLMTGLPTRASEATASLGSKSLRRSSGNSSISQSIKDQEEH